MWNLFSIGILGFIVVVLVILAIIFLLRKEKLDRQNFPQNRSLEILQERFAKGEIDEEEYKSRRAVIEEELNKR